MSSQTTMIGSTQECIRLNDEVLSRAKFAMTVIQLDYVMMYLKRDVRFVRARPDSPLPVIRIFGSTPNGQRALLHIHGALPYLYFRPTLPDDITFKDESSIRERIDGFIRELDKLLEERRQINAQEGIPRRRFPQKYVDSMAIVKRTSIYGLQGPQWFIRVNFRHPGSVKLCAKILEAGEFCGSCMSTWEAHIPFLLQFTSDLNIKPGGWLYLDDTYLFRGVPSSHAEAKLTCGPTVKDESEDIRFAKMIYKGVPQIKNRMWNAEESHYQARDANDNQPVQKLTSSVGVSAPVLNPFDFSAPPPKQAPYGSAAFPLLNLETKLSTCSLELDASYRSVLNSHLIIPSFGAELWEAEVKRRQRVGLSADEPSIFRGIPQFDFISVPEWKPRLASLIKTGNRLRGKSSVCDDLVSLTPLSNDGSLSGKDDFAGNALNVLMQAVSEEDLYSVNLSVPDIPGTADSHRAGYEAHVDDEDSEVLIQEEWKDILSMTQITDSPPSPNEEVKPSGKELTISHGPTNELITGKAHLSSALPNESREVKVNAKIMKRRGSRDVNEVFGPNPKRVFSKPSQIKESQDILLRQFQPGKMSLLHEEIIKDDDKLNDGSSFYKSKAVFTEHEFIRPAFKPPRSTSLRSLKSCEQPNILNVRPFFSVIEDEPRGNRLYSSVFFEKEHSHRAAYRNAIKRFDGGAAKPSIANFWICEECTCKNACDISACCACDKLRKLPEVFSRRRFLRPAFRPPTRAELRIESLSTKKISATQISTPSKSATQSLGMRPAPASLTFPATDGSAAEEFARFTLTSIEVLFRSAPDLYPDPKKDSDSIELVIYATDDVRASDEHEAKKRSFGIIAVVRERDLNSRERFLSNAGLPPDTLVDLVESEITLLVRFVQRIISIDPDLLCGYEIQRSSVGLLFDRADYLKYPLRQLLSRLPNEAPSFSSDNDPSDEYASHHESGIFIKGRILLNLWRRMQAELKLNNYSLGNVSHNLLHRSVPEFTIFQLQRWYCDHRQRHRAVRHIFRLAELDLLLVEALDLIRRTCESARLYGIDFFSVLTRGSQYRVEASLIARAHARDFLLLSPSSTAVTKQAPLESQPLILEPKSAFYEDPVVVLDFQSLYPSMCIAYNLCFSTIFAKFNPGSCGTEDTTGRLGVIAYPEAQAALASTLHEEHEAPYISPSGAAFVNSSIRVGVLPSMLREILATRQMIKRAMKTCQAGSVHANAVLHRVLEARQMAIKLLANVTYGYAAASFSGRMPMAELADAIVTSGRTTLENAMYRADHEQKWSPLNVVYGDTDSLFLQLPGRNRSEAFAIGRQVARSITDLNPPDVTLKFEKVYFPCVLVAKKRYAGLMWEEERQTEGSFDAKGLECVRRDQCLATQKMMEKVLRTLFKTRDLSAVRAYLIAQFSRLLLGTQGASIRDFVFSKEVRLGSYSAHSEPPGALLAMRRIERDPQDVPPNGWRVPYVVCSKAPNTLLRDLVESPLAVLSSQRSEDPIRINGLYYVEKCVLPALERVLVLCGADIRNWYKNMSRPNMRARSVSYASNSSDFFIKRAYNRKQLTMDAFVTTTRCLLCNADAKVSLKLCPDCTQELSSASATEKLGKIVAAQTNRLNDELAAEAQLAAQCRQCANGAQPSQPFLRYVALGHDTCSNIDCKVFHSRCRRVLAIEDAHSSLSETQGQLASLQW